MDFSQYKLSDCQLKAVKMFESVFEGETKVGILQGYAGTGKTYLIGLLIKQLEDHGWGIKVITPTGRAAKILSNAMKNYKIKASPQTIHSLIYQIKPIDYSLSQLNIFGDLKSNEGLGKTAYIIDEGSMLGNQKNTNGNALLQLGSGSLLDDILDFVSLETNEENRILFVGDPAQLPPINQNNEASPALSRETILVALKSREVTSEVGLTELTSVFRQSDGSLLEFIQDVRFALHQETSLPRNQRESVRAVPYDQAIGLFRELTVDAAQPEKAIILAHANRDVYTYNRMVRESIGRNSKLIEEGDVLMIRKNRIEKDHGELDIAQSGLRLTNGTFIKVCSPPISLEKKTVQLKGKSVELGFVNADIEILGEGIKVNVVIIENMLRADFWDDYRTKASELESAMLVEFQNRMFETKKLKPVGPGKVGYDLYSKLAEVDLYLNALRVNYGYAVTVHNAQGGEWPNVIVDPKNPARDWAEPSQQISFKRWVYTASTRASMNLWFIKRSNSTYVADQFSFMSYESM